MRIQSVELVSLPNAPTWQEKVYRAHLENGEDMDLFQQHWDDGLGEARVFIVERGEDLQILRIEARLFRGRESGRGPGEVLTKWYH